jgi:cyclase
VQDASTRRFPLDMLERITVQSCGKSRVIMGGLAEDLHQRNLIALYRHLFGKPPIGSEEIHDSEEEFEDYEDDEYEKDYEEEPIRVKDSYDEDDEDEEEGFERDEDTGALFEVEEEFEEGDLE